jgi:nucleoside-diphosphate-sugar epimerase
MASPILVTGAAGRVGAIGRTVTELLLKQGEAVRAMVRTEDERAQALRDMGCSEGACPLIWSTTWLRWRISTAPDASTGCRTTCSGSRGKSR